jgi:hypothetical protein
MNPPFLSPEKFAKNFSGLATVKTWFYRRSKSRDTKSAAAICRPSMAGEDTL